MNLCNTYPIFYLLFVIIFGIYSTCNIFLGPVSNAFLSVQTQIRKLYSYGFKSSYNLWCYEQRNFSFTLESSPLVTCEVSRLGNYQNPSFKQFSKAIQKGNYLCGLVVCDVAVRFTTLCKGVLAVLLKLVYKDMRLPRTSSPGVFLHTNYYRYGERDAHTDTPCLMAFIQVKIWGYFNTFWINLENGLCFVLLRYSSYILCYILGRNTDK